MRATTFGRERTVDYCAEPQVTRVVKADHRACELRDLRRHLVERRACRKRAEDLGMATGMVDVVESGERPVAGARRETREIRNFEEGDRRLASQRRERSIAQVVIALPELERPEVDIAKRYVGGGTPFSRRAMPARCIVVVIIVPPVSLSVAP